MIELEGKKFLNEQEAYLYCLEQIKIIKQSLGNALPDPIQGPIGLTGETGARGPEGPRGNGIFGCTAVLPSATAYQEGDMYLLFNGQLYKKINGSWVMQTTLKGPQGPTGLVGGSEVVANPADAATDELNKVKIDGTTYNIKDFSSSEVTDLKNIASGSLYYDSDNNIYVFDDVAVEFTYPTIFDVMVVNSLSQIMDENNNPIVICENFNDANGNARFVEGNITTTAKTGVTYTYAKWSLSGSHLMFVICMTIESGTTMHNEYFANIPNLPDYIKDKIIPVWANEFVEMNKFTAYDNNWNSQQLDIAIGKSGGSIYFYQPGNVTFSSTKNIRIEFDLLIDMA